MEIMLVDEQRFSAALEVYIASWQESHRDVCTSDFLKYRDYDGYLKRKLGSLWMISDPEPVGVFSLSGEEFGDLYIHPAYQKQGYGTACIRFALSQTHDLRLTVLSTNLSAIALYEKIGFRFTGNTIPLKNGLWEREMKYMEH